MEELLLEIERQTKINPEIEIVVSLEQYFEGNDDLGSIGANLGAEHPTIKFFYAHLKDIRLEKTVQDVLVRITDYSDPDSWPHSDAIYILSTNSIDDIETWVSELLPDEITKGWMYGVPEYAPNLGKGMKPYSIFWD